MATSNARRLLQWAFLAMLFGLAGCLGQFQFLEDFEAVDGKLYLLVSPGSPTLGPVSLGDGAHRRLLESVDNGRNWTLIRDGLSARDLTFSNGSCLLYLQGNDLFRSRDGGRTVEEVRPTPSPILNLIGLEKAAAAVSEQTLFITRDCGEAWDEFGIEPVTEVSAEPWTATLAAVAVDGEELAVANRFGRVYQFDSKSRSWNEVIVGPISDLAYHNGTLYALTAGMGTLTRIESSGFTHLLTDIRDSAPHFERCGGDLFAVAGGRLLRLDDAGFQTVAAVPTRQGGMSPRTALGPSCEQLFVVTSDFQEIELARVDLENGQVERAAITLPD